MICIFLLLWLLVDTDYMKTSSLAYIVLLVSSFDLSDRTIF